MSKTSPNIKKKWKQWFQSINTIDDYFIIFGIILNAFSLVVSFAYGHMIAGIILTICEIILIGAYIMKIF